MRRLLKRHVIAIETPEAPTRVGWVSGTSFVVRRTVLETAGLFDETFFLYWEEVELCYRIHKSGFCIYGVPEAIVQHSGGISTGMHDPSRRTPAYWFESRNHFFHVTGLARNLTLLNLAVTCGLVVQRTHQLIRRRSLNPPHFLHDFVKFSLVKPKE